MARYIDADALWEELKKLNWSDDNVMYHIAKVFIEDAPTADVVEVVRCSQCKHLTVHNSPTLYAYCEKEHIRFEPFQKDTRTHFCSCGERR